MKQAFMALFQLEQASGHKFCLNVSVLSIHILINQIFTNNIWFCTYTQINCPQSRYQILLIDCDVCNTINGNHRLNCNKMKRTK